MNLRYAKRSEDTEQINVTSWAAWNERQYPELKWLRGFNPDIRMKLLMTMRQKNMTSIQVEEWLKASSGQDCFQTAIRRSIVAEKATMERVPLPKFSKSGIVAKDYREVAEELLKDMEG